MIQHEALKRIACWSRAKVDENRDRLWRTRHGKMLFGMKEAVLSENQWLRPCQYVTSPSREVHYLQVWPETS